MMIRQLTERDIGAVMQVQRESYWPDLLEPPSAFLRKMALFPEGAVGCFRGSLLVGYLFCHPWRSGVPAPLSAENMILPQNPDALYVHDLAVRRACRGRGISGSLLDTAFRLAQDLSLGTIDLVAVQGSERFWERHGFGGVCTFEYRPGIRAVLMRRNLEQPEVQGI